MVRRLLSLGATRGGPCRCYLIARRTDYWRHAVISSISALYGCSCRRESAGIYIRPPGDVRSDGVSYVDAVPPRLPRPQPPLRGGRFWALAMRPRLLTMGARSSRSRKRRPNARDRRTAYCLAAFNSKLEARYRPRPLIQRAGRFAAARGCAASFRRRIRSAASAHRLGGRRTSAAMRASCVRRQVQLYNRHVSESATARRWRRLSPDKRGMDAAYFGDGGIPRSHRGGGRLRKYRGCGDR